MKSSSCFSWRCPMRAATSLRLDLPPGSSTSACRRPGSRLSPWKRCSSTVCELGVRWQAERAAFDRGHVLVRVEAERDDVAEAADALACEARADGMRGVFDHAQAAPLVRSRRRASCRPASPAKCTGMIARVRGVMAASSACGSMLRVSSSTSTNTGFAPTRITTLALAANVIAGTITSSPGPDAAGLQRDLQRRGGGGERAHDAPAEIVGQSALELLHLRPAGDPARAQDFDDAGDGVFVEGGFGERQVAHLFVLTICTCPNLETQRTQRKAIEIEGVFSSLVWKCDVVLQDAVSLRSLCFTLCSLCFKV